jgi:hypothetical protein
MDDLRAEIKARPELAARVEALERCKEAVKQAERRFWDAIRLRDKAWDQLEEAVTAHLPGVFIEECPPTDVSPFLSAEELFECIIPILQSGAWHKLGYETGRERGAVSLKADWRESHILNTKNWHVGPEAPGSEYRLWAVEFPKDDGRYVRRRFWVISHYHVPENGGR